MTRKIARLILPSSATCWSQVTMTCAAVRTSISTGSIATNQARIDHRHRDQQQIVDQVAPRSLPMSLSDSHISGDRAQLSILFLLVIPALSRDPAIVLVLADASSASKK